MILMPLLIQGDMLDTFLLGHSTYFIANAISLGIYKQLQESKSFSYFIANRSRLYLATERQVC